MGVKVSNVNRSDPSLLTMRGPDIRRIDENETLMFHRTLTDLSKEAHAVHLQKLKMRIDEQGNRLADKVDVKEYEKYRRLIRDFIDEIVSNGYSFQREDAYASRGRHRYIATVRIVDEKLDELGKEVMKEQADQIEILSKIDDIRGLLLDLMM